MQCMTKRNRIEVYLNGLPYTLLTDRSENEAEEIIEYVEKLVDQLALQHSSLTKLALSQLSALNIAEELFAEKDAYSRYQEHSRIPLEKYPELLEEIEKYKSTIREKENQETVYRRKLEEKNRDIFEKNKKIKDLENTISQKSEKIEALEKNQSRLEKIFLDNQQSMNRLRKELEELKGKVR